MNIIITDILYFKKDDNTLHHINVFTDGKKVLTDSKAKQFVKSVLDNGDKFVEKSKKIIDIPITDILNTPLLSLLEKECAITIYTETEADEQD